VGVGVATVAGVPHAAAIARLDNSKECDTNDFIGIPGSKDVSER
jgi:hypothetical protein